MTVAKISPRKRSRKSGAKKAASSRAAGKQPIEEMVVLLLKASLRGRLLPADRRAIKKFLGQVAAERKQARPAESERPRCPACRSVLENPRAKRCPYCSVLLGAARRAKSRAGKK